MTQQTQQSVRRRQTPAQHRRGAMMVFVAVLMIAFLATVVFSIDLAHMHLTRTQLRSATDAAAKAAAQELSATQSRADARRQAKAIASQNLVAGKPLLLNNADIKFGRSVADPQSGKFIFQTSGTPINSIQILGDRSSGSASGSVKLLFGGIFGVEDFQPQQEATATFLERDVVLVVDRSGSMFGQKATDLKNAINIFVNTLSGTPVEEVVGLASYSSSATADVALTTSLGQITTAMNSMRFSGSTSISAGMSVGGAILSGGRNTDFVERTMIVMTDGIHNAGRDPQTDAQILATQGVFIHTITFGAGADITRMKRIATTGRGKHFHADNGAQLIAIYREIALTLSTLITK
ncbi:von Willebrand factor type A domain protein [Rosistilla ulvae]|uniref:von Willebrand factor type A domain protein n=1 Tax=Rosistilla ulvae TaxID=1930277 RepID=A0A517M6C6_9BACT|nr:VWA domain-containing protein [Rosistilla ulvae]QDS90430.1 von Willebrand factor type A domain protein [Rosistilla ulvae]